MRHLLGKSRSTETTKLPEHEQRSRLQPSHEDRSLDAIIRGADHSPCRTAGEMKSGDLTEQAVG
jgi:hypothetical protein